MKKKLPYILIRTSTAFCFLFLCINLSAQICTGSLGDAVVNVTFGTGSNPGNPLPGNITSYSFTAGDCPNDGSYTIVNSTSGCFADSWHSLTQDHTSAAGTPNGYMMLINASFNPGDFYVDTVKNLCASTTYEFGAWILNVLKPTSCSPNPIHPKLVFTIETFAGVVLGTYSTGDIIETSSPEWKQYGLFFTTAAGSNAVVIRITNNAPGGCGNDLALDDITFRPCGPAVTATIINNSSTSIGFCSGNIMPVTFSSTIGSGYSLPSLQWQESLNNGTSWTDIPGATGSTFIFTKTNTGAYQYRLTVAEGSNISISNCRVASNPDTINIRELPVADAKSNSPICENGTVELTASGGQTYSWSGPGGFTATGSMPSFAASLLAAGPYSVIAADAFGCKAPAATTILINPKPAAVASNDKTICKGDPVQLESSGGISYLWFPADGISNIIDKNPLANPVNTTTYSVVVSNADNCKDTATVTITVNTKPVADAGPDKFILKGESAVLDGNVPGTAVSFFWTPADFLNNPLAKNPVTNITHDTIYTLHVVSNIGCGTAADDVLVKVFGGLFIPNAFSPNNDGKNETWKIEALSVFPKAVLAVYNRYGQKVFESIGNRTSWDGNYKGQPADTGAHIYFINLKNGRPVIKGTVLLIR